MFCGRILNDVRRDNIRIARAKVDDHSTTDVSGAASPRHRNSVLKFHGLAYGLNTEKSTSDIHVVEVVKLNEGSFSNFQGAVSHQPREAVHQQGLGNSGNGSTLIFGSHVAEARVYAYSSAVDGVINAAEVPDRRVHHGLDAQTIGDVYAECNGTKLWVLGQRRALSYCLLCRSFIDVRKDHSQGSFYGIRERTIPSDPRT